MYWKNKKIDIGTIKPNSQHVIKFEANNNIPDIKNLSSSCGCSQPSFDRTNLIMTVEFSSGPIPKHLKGGQQTFEKTITVEYNDGKKDYLKFKGIKK